MAGLASVEFGLAASLGRRPLMSMVRLAATLATDKRQISPALAEDGPDGLSRPEAGGGRGIGLKEIAAPGMTASGDRPGGGGGAGSA
jgi:hypothetical protein